MQEAEFIRNTGGGKTRIFYIEQKLASKHRQNSLANIG